MKWLLFSGMMFLIPEAPFAEGEKLPDKTIVLSAPVENNSDAKDSEWLNRIKDDALYRYAAKLGGGVAKQFVSNVRVVDGKKYGTLSVAFEEGVTFRATTAPPESVVVELFFSRNEPSAANALEALKSYAKETGLNIAWDSPECEHVSGNRYCRYAGPETGFNAQAEQAFKNGRIVSIAISFSL